ncbi:MAG: glycosyltransferase family 2 protein [Bacteriovoracaceae bacterium]|jgi:dolichol-phosphate mannosyltransferase|nr:glycosyltransferase family 2 protein [Bacteriovoracaceae bacterium]
MKTTTAIVIPCYKVKDHIRSVVTSIPEFIDHIIVVDDCCPENSLEQISDLAQTNSKITTISHQKNGGVGAAMATGYKKALEQGATITIKMDGDGQMAPCYLPRIIELMENKKCDYVKGNRFSSKRILSEMPLARLIGNSGLSFLVKFASGYWNVMDPTNGYTAIHIRALKDLNLNKLSSDYFFEIDMLCQLNYQTAKVRDFSMDAKYEHQNSSLNVFHSLNLFTLKLLHRFVKRLFLQYFILEFNMATVYMLLGIPLLVFGTIFGGVLWAESIRNSSAQPLGTIMLSVLPVLISLNMLTHAIHIDISRNYDN